MPGSKGLFPSLVNLDGLRFRRGFCLTGVQGKRGSTDQPRLFIGGVSYFWYVEMYEKSMKFLVFENFLVLRHIVVCGSLFYHQPRNHSYLSICCCV